MSVLTKTVRCLCLFVGLAFSADSWADSWLRAESDHFLVYSSVSDTQTITYVKKLEAFRTLTNMLLGSNDNAVKAKFKIYLLSDPDQIQVVRPELSKNVVGIYFNCSEGSSAYSTAPRYSNQEQNLAVLFHEYTHYVMFQHARSYYPAWFVEGFAEYLSTAYPDHDQISVGGYATMRHHTLATDRWMGFDKLLDPTFKTAGAKTSEAWDVERFYAQSWLLTHYMLSDPARSKALYAYFAAIGGGADPLASWESITGIKIESLHRVLTRYLANMYFMRVPVPGYAVSAIQLTRLPEGTDRFMLKGSLLATCPGPALGKEILSSLLAQKSELNDSAYRLDLARAHLQFGEPADAEADLNKMLTANPNDFQANYLLGRVRLAQAGKATGDAKSDLTDQARALFMTAYRANRLDAPNLYSLAKSFSNKPNFPDSNVLNAADAAHHLAPAVLEYAIFDAIVNLANHKAEKAAAVLTPFGSDPHNRDQAMRIQKAIEAIKAGSTTNEVMHLLTPTP